MQLRYLLIILVLVALVTTLVTIPSAHKLFNHQQQEPQKQQLSIPKSQKPLPTKVITAANTNEEEEPNSIRENSDNDKKPKATQFPKIIPEQMEPTEIVFSQDHHQGEFLNPYKPLIENEDFLKSSGFAQAMKKLKKSSAETTEEHQKPEKSEKEDDFKKAKNHKKCSMLKYTQGKWVRRDKPPRVMYPALGEILGCCERGFVRDKGLLHKKELLGHDDEQQETTIQTTAKIAEDDGDNTNSNNQDSPIKATKPINQLPPVIVNNNLENEFREELHYEWVPESCDLIPWSEELFCKALRGRDIMFAGDSLNDHWHASLYYLLGGTKDMYKYEGTIGGKKRCKGHPICAKYYKKPLKLHHLTNQYLSESSYRNRNYKWWRPIRKYPILVLNSGSWMRDVFDERVEISDEKWRGLMKKALGLVRREEYNGTIIWRTTYAGHPFCWDYKKPLERPLTKEEFPNVNPYNKYRWDTIPERNKFTTKLWSNAGAHVLDVERLTGMMPLGHLGKNHPKFASTRNATDCLHYCSPGPVYDTWSQLLMNLLLGNFDE